MTRETKYNIKQRISQAENIRIEYSQTNLTNYRGLVPIRQSNIRDGKESYIRKICLIR